jgi:hypothetical protein
VRQFFLILGGIELQQCDPVRTARRLPAMCKRYDISGRYAIPYSGPTRVGSGGAENWLQLTERNALDLGKAGLDTNLPE